MHFLHIAFLVDFRALEDVTDMPRDAGLIDTEELDDLRLGCPHRLTLGVERQGELHAWSGVDDDVLLAHGAPSRSATIASIWVRSSV